ncbi:MULTISPECIES: amidohydrolase family protein [unclassified Pseudomonas]|uniref:N-acyl-D-amino-acid deacylase family protein n=1 Tax=unclassified Pseudomonas TaxID=196821 RepID=UPI0007301935|nr:MULTISPECIES: amidohydrolase family protein [unclassified Pseudomonas]KSW25808.1 N-acyl-D-glutamate amidohydrolase [Pseudomonas sp. ADP]OBP12325.1 N-acyl-D-glutamate amidohydrolase [Pseudomonas sp. EGD-AKN5]QOF82409.1 amidohydrolase family protein [Pseudomonas sp. ADPe]
MFDIIIKNGLYFDGSGASGSIRHLGIRDGRVAVVSEQPLKEWSCARVIDARDRWVMPGFLEIHSHYDAEVIAAPALKESVRHGVTTVAVGSCSLSTIVASPLDCSDLFTRVEAVPREAVLPMLERSKSWDRPQTYRAFLDEHPLGPNVCAFLGHSDLRVAVMGMERATSPQPPSESEMRRMEQLLEEALDAGLLGLSVMTTRLDKIDGDRAWSRPLPSTFANWSEFGRLFEILRRRGGVLQGAPDAVTKINIFAFLWHAMGWSGRRLRMTMLTAMDLKSQPWMHAVTRAAGWIANRLLRADFRWQMLPAPFRIHVRGLDFNVFEEFTSGELLRDLRTADEQYGKIRDPQFRAQFKRDLKAVLSVGLWHRDFSDGTVTHCPEGALVGRNFAEIGRTLGKDPVDTFFDLCLEHGEALRWTTQLANHRPHVMHKLLRSPHTQVGFADSGAHIRNLAGYNFPLRLLKYVRDAYLEGTPIMKLGQAVHRTSGELADWFGLDAGHLRVGDRADLVVVNPVGLTDELDQVHEDVMENLGLIRLVNRNDTAVDYTLINGNIAYSRREGFAQDLGKTRRFGRFLPSLGVH